jgi:hypothetical protein
VFSPPHQQEDRASCAKWDVARLAVTNIGEVKLTPALLARV